MAKCCNSPLLFPTERDASAGAMLAIARIHPMSSNGCGPCSFRALTQRDGRAALCTPVILAVQPCLWTDVELVLGLVADFGAHAGLGDEVQTLAVTAVITSWDGGREVGQQ